MNVEQWGLVLTPDACASTSRYLISNFYLLHGVYICVCEYVPQFSGLSFYRGSQGLKPGHRTFSASPFACWIIVLLLHKCVHVCNFHRNVYCILGLLSPLTLLCCPFFPLLSFLFYTLGHFYFFISYRHTCFYVSVQNPETMYDIKHVILVSEKWFSG